MVQLATPFEALQEAISRAGSQSALARICAVSQTAVWKWVQSGKRLPAEHVLKVEATTGVSKHVLRPDIYPSTNSDRIDVVRSAAAVRCDRSPKFQPERGA